MKREELAMPYESIYRQDKDLIYFRYWGRVTDIEFYASIFREEFFFANTSGMVGIIFEIDQVRRFPPLLFSYLRCVRFLKYQPAVIAIVRPNRLGRALVQLIKRLTPNPVIECSTRLEAEKMIEAKMERYWTGEMF
jgi:hypothetical protein